jgi:arylsulfatase
MEQRTKRMDIGRDPLVTLRAPKLFNLRRDLFGRADTDSNNYDRWWIEHVGNMWPGAAGAAEFFKTSEKFPRHQKPAKFNMDEE